MCTLWRSSHTSTGRSGDVDFKINVVKILNKKMSCTQVPIFRRLLFLIVYVLSLPLVVICFVLSIPLALFSIFSWLFTGCSDEELMFRPLKWSVGLVYKIIE